MGSYNFKAGPKTFTIFTLFQVLMRDLLVLGQVQF
ncbi:hypothetical protein LSS_21160 [Leptospira santarosai serovar Shermani str. LT 821]|uniref:Uncharacterized protein n=1 Tax=Leptospira santarosai serovar Shermani str. LT 821 TaxID=758847 RepID=A0A097ESD6_9LEPT|nr:hypothetical protein LSS_21160 [Leptospira santarosai serovar Shermani str. LT 821]